MASEATTIEVPGPHGVRTMRISSPSRVLWPAEGITKLEFAEYLIAVGEAFVEANGNRPLSLERFPEGIEGERFFSKNPPRGTPGFVRAVEVEYPSRRRHPQLVIDEPAAAVWAAQMNAITFHPWPCRAGDSDHPDQFRIDLDPQPGTEYADAVRIALQLREVLAEAGLTAFVKTSGNRGLHVFAPIRPAHDFIAVRHGVIAAARALERRDPERISTAWWKEERGARVFVDFNQAARDRTMAGAYSPRPLPGAPVSTPLGWEELPHSDPREHTVRTVPTRLASTGDPWAGMADAPGDLGILLEWWERDLADGLGELPYPPDYPKMPGEPPRVQPSRARTAPTGG
ncbi:MAG: DNA polymerase domain-containing protein [Micrococcales bacterium]|nr:DNA polymerase domain-containing protein [Micrococcales bacterium]